MSDFENITQVIHNRRSIFPGAFTGELVEESLLMQILNNANQAPTHKKTEPWRFHIVRPENKAAYLTFVQKAFKEAFVGERFSQLKYDKLEKKLNKTSHIIMVSMHVDPEANLPEWEEVAATACAMQNLYLSVTAAGLGGYWSSPGFFIRSANQFFDMHEYEKCLGLFYLGVPQEELPPKHVKSPIEEKIKFY